MKPQMDIGVDSCMPVHIKTGIFSNLKKVVQLKVLEFLKKLNGAPPVGK